MPKTPVHLHDLRRRRDAQAKAAPSWRFWGLSGPSCTPDTRQEASQLAKANNGAPGMDGVTFAAIAASGVDELLEPRRPALVTRTSRPRRVRHQAMPKNGGQGGRVLSRPTIRARVVPGAGKRIREPLCAADFQPGSYGYRPKRSAHDASDSNWTHRVGYHQVVRRKLPQLPIERLHFFTRPRGPNDDGGLAALHHSRRRVRRS